MTRPTDRVYERLEPHERAVAIVAAMAPRDDVEAERLERSCPRRTYRMLDARFTDEASALELVATALALELQRSLAHLATLLAARESTALVLDSVRTQYELTAQGPTPGARRTPQEDVSVGAGPDQHPTDLRDARVDEIIADGLQNLDELIGEAAAFVRATWDGFVEWASTRALDARLLVGAFAGFLDEGLGEHELVLDAAEPDASAVRAFRDLCAALWDKYHGAAAGHLHER